LTELVSKINDLDEAQKCPLRGYFSSLGAKVQKRANRLYEALKAEKPVNYLQRAFGA